MMTGLGAGAVVMPAIVHRLITGFGWRNAFGTIGALILIFPVPLIGLLFRESPEQMGLLPDGEAGRRPMVKTSEGFEWREIRRTRTFWWMILAFGLASASVQGCYVHLAELFTDRGSGVAAAAAISTAGLALFLGRSATGYFLDRYFAPNVSLFVFALAAAGIAMLWTNAGTAPALAGAFLVGLGIGSEVDIIAYLMSRYFGLRSLGKALGFALGMFVLAGGLGPLIMGFLFDHMVSYRVPLAAFFAATLLAAVVLGRLGPYRFKVAEETEAEGVVE
jgi:predicted MFS family arabinose efflux permease